MSFFSEDAFFLYFFFFFFVIPHLLAPCNPSPHKKEAWSASFCFEMK